MYYAPAERNNLNKQYEKNAIIGLRAHGFARGGGTDRNIS